jgi:hypothetical protein
MAHWAELNESNEVIRVIVGDNNDPNGDEGYQWILENLGGHWVKTSYNGNIRKNYAGPGFRYDEALDAFIPPKPLDSWVLDEETCKWKPSIDMPNDGLNYFWNENSLAWELENFPGNS